MKITSWVFFVLFIIFAALQYNDPDPLLWIMIYGYVAVIALLYVFDIYPIRLILLSIIVGVGFSLFYFPAVLQWISTGTFGEIVQEMQATKPYIEESREFMGLCIAISVLLFYFFKEKRSER